MEHHKIQDMELDYNATQYKRHPQEGGKETRTHAKSLLEGVDIGAQARHQNGKELAKVQHVYKA